MCHFRIFSIHFGAACGSFWGDLGPVWFHFRRRLDAGAVFIHFEPISPDFGVTWRQFGLLLSTFWGDFGALRCCGRRSFLPHFLQPPSPWQQGDITATVLGRKPYFLPFPPPPPCIPHLSILQGPPVQRVPPCTPRGLCTSRAPIARGAPWGLI